MLHIMSSFKSIALVSREEKRAQILLGKWNKNQKERTNEYSILSNSRVPALKT